MEIFIKLLLFGAPALLILKIWLDAKKDYKNMADYKAEKRRAKIRALVGDEDGRKKLDEKMARVNDIYNKYVERYGDPNLRIKRDEDRSQDKRD